MRLRVLGSSAGGGFPQWNCGCANCRDVRRGDPQLAPRLQDSLALSADGDRWFLLNAGPDIAHQIERTPELQPKRPRHSPISGIVLTNGDLDHILGLFSMRESQPLAIYTTEAIWGPLAERSVLVRTLQRSPDQLSFRPLPLGTAVELAGPDHVPSGVVVTALAVPGKLALHLDGLVAPSPGDNIALSIREPATGHHVAYASTSASIGSFLDPLAGADCLLFDGTFWSDDELSRLGLSTRTAREMAHVPIGGEGGSLAQLAAFPARRRIYTHINNTNPILRAGTPERLAVEARGWEVGYDGLEIRREP